MNTFKSKKKNLFSLEAEQTIIGALLINNSFWQKILDTLNIDDFFFKIHKVIFSIINVLMKKNETYNLFSVSNEIKKLNSFKSYYGYLFFLVQKTPNLSNIDDCIKVINKMTILRKLLKISKVINNNIKSFKNVSSDEILNRFELEVFNLNKSLLKDKSELVTISPVLENVLEKIDTLNNNNNPFNGVFTGYPKLDAILSGLHEGELIIIAGRPSMGKTAFAINIALNVALKTNMPVIIFSLEMSVNQLSTRILSILSDFDQNLIRTGNLLNFELKKLKQLIKKLYFTKLFIDESVYLNSNDMYNKSKKIIRENGNIGLIVIDYLQLMNSLNSNQNRVMEISDISRSLKCLARDLNVPIIAISQLNRDLEGRGNKRPVMSDLRESGAIEQDADVILFIYRDEVYNNNNNNGKTEIIVSKQRNGPTGYVSLNFSNKSLKFTSIL